MAPRKPKISPSVDARSETPSTAVKAPKRLVSDRDLDGGRPRASPPLIAPTRPRPAGPGPGRGRCRPGSGRCSARSERRPRRRGARS
ncbi:MAG: hypothetical protein MZV63_72510 [Marinilabiliales bacterium]|nr:hypothetical protein [Marinilabiliales bacterium]